jgi:hypothetical protein
MKKVTMSRGLRNHNPGNIRNSQRTEWSGELPSEDKKDSDFEEFIDDAHGYRALIKLLQNYRRLYGCRTISEFISRWAPAHENNTAGYINRVCREMQVPSTYVPDINDEATMCAMAAAISQVENEVPAVMDDVRAGWELLKVK